jgi:NAD(P)H-hydrate repair Nnr-like enzyme with NAD(P)H-hydrate dehydratase domain
MTAADEMPPLPPRPAHGHKGTFGTVLVVGGSCGERTMLGGPAFAALAALRSGCGIVELAMPASLLPMALSIVPSATGVALPVASIPARPRW